MTRECKLILVRPSKIPRVWIGDILRKHRIQRHCTRGEDFCPRKAPKKEIATCRRCRVQWVFGPIWTPQVDNYRCHGPNTLYHTSKELTWQSQSVPHSILFIRDQTEKRFDWSVVGWQRRTDIYLPWMVGPFFFFSAPNSKCLQRPGGKKNRKKIVMKPRLYMY